MVGSYPQTFTLGQHSTYVHNGGQPYYQASSLRYQQPGSSVHYIPLQGKTLLMVEVSKFS